MRGFPKGDSVAGDLLCFRLREGEEGAGGESGGSVRSSIRTAVVSPVRNSTRVRQGSFILLLTFNGTDAAHLALEAPG